MPTSYNLGSSQCGILDKKAIEQNFEPLHKEALQYLGLCFLMDAIRTLATFILIKATA